MGLLSDIGTLFGGSASAIGAISQIKANQDNLAFQRENLEYQKGIDQFNMDMANKQFDAQLALNERNSITGQISEMARNGLNPLTGSSFANGSGAVSGSQVSSGVQAVVAPNDFSAMSQLGDTLSNSSLQKSAQNMSLAIAKMQDKNTLIQLAGKLIDSGVSPRAIEDELKKAGIDTEKLNLWSENPTKANYQLKNSQAYHWASLTHDEDELGHTLDYMNMKNGNPYMALNDLDMSDPKSILGGILGLIKLLK